MTDDQDGKSDTGDGDEDNADDEDDDEDSHRPEEDGDAGAERAIKDKGNAELLHKVDSDPVSSAVEALSATKALMRARGPSSGRRLR